MGNKRLALTQPLHHGRHRLVEISEDGKQVKLISALEYSRFSHYAFFEVNKLTHNVGKQCKIMGKDITLEQALAIVSQSYQPNWYKDTGHEYTSEQIAMMDAEQDGVKREMDYLKALIAEETASSHN